MTSVGGSGLFGTAMNYRHCGAGFACVGMRFVLRIRRVSEPVAAREGPFRMSIPAFFKRRRSFRVIDSPLFMVSGPELVMAQWESEVLGAFPLNAGPQSMLDERWARIEAELTEHDSETSELLSAPPSGGSTACFSKGD